MSKLPLEELKDELKRLQREQFEYISETGYVLGHKRYKYQKLMEQIRALKRAIDSAIILNQNNIEYR